MVLECVEKKLAKEITNSISIPTIGIGSSNNCDGQVLVTDDVLGLTDSKIRFVKKFTDIKWPSDIGIIGNQLTFIVWDQKEPVLYIIQSKVLVDSYSIFFNDIWNKAK